MQFDLSSPQHIWRILQTPGLLLWNSHTVTAASWWQRVQMVIMIVDKSENCNPILPRKNWKRILMSVDSFGLMTLMLQMSLHHTALTAVVSSRYPGTDCSLYPLAWLADLLCRLCWSITMGYGHSFLCQPGPADTGLGWVQWRAD